jgi:hypothetical protein
MFDFLKRNNRPNDIPLQPAPALDPVYAPAAPGQDNAVADLRRSVETAKKRDELKREAQLCLHENSIFPSAIQVAEDQWIEVTFYPSNRQGRAAETVLRRLHQQGRIVLGALDSREDGSWSTWLQLGRA